jgi:hypothetical protein
MNASSEDKLELLDIFTAHGFLEPPNPQATILRCKCPNVDSLATLKRLQPIHCPRHQETTLTLLLKSAFYTLDLSGTDLIPMLLEYLNPDWSRDPDMVCSTHDDITAYNLSEFPGVCYAQSSLNSPIYLVFLCIHLDKFCSNQAAGMFAIEVVQRTEGLHDLDLEEGILTPLAEGLIWAQFHLDRFERDGVSVIRDIGATISLWLQLLEDAGVDLVQYGWRELELFRSNEGWDVQWECPLVWPISFEIASVKDFRFYWNEMTDEYAAEFWSLVEELVYSIPGGWVD